jgi:hypothetical protein
MKGIAYECNRLSYIDLQERDQESLQEIYFQLQNDLKRNKIK